MELNNELSTYLSSMSVAHLETDLVRSEFDIVSNLKSSKKVPTQVLSFKVTDENKYQITTVTFDGEPMTLDYINEFISAYENDKENVNPSVNSQNDDDSLKMSVRKRCATTSSSGLLTLKQFKSAVTSFFSPSFNMKPSKNNLKSMNSNNNFDAAILISIEGNIGAGKSTLLKALRKAHPSWVFIDEPVDTWTALKTDDGTDLLSLFYKDQERWAYTFQNVALLSRYQNIQSAIAQRMNASTTEPTVFVTERCLDTDRNVFAKRLRYDGVMNKLEYDLYEKWFTLLAQTATQLSGIVYVGTVPEVCDARIRERNRSGEEGIPLAYLKGLDELQRSWCENTTLPKLITQETKIVDEVSKFVNNLCDTRRKTLNNTLMNKKSNHVDINQIEIVVDSTAGKSTPFSKEANATALYTPHPNKVSKINLVR